MSKQITIKVKGAFGSSRIEAQTFLVEGDEVKIWDDVAGYFSTCHSLSERVLSRIRRLAD